MKMDKSIRIALSRDLSPRMNSWARESFHSELLLIVLIKYRMIHLPLSLLVSPQADKEADTARGINSALCICGDLSAQAGTNAGEKT